MQTGKRWFIDAWAAVDGRAFASFRAAEIPGNRVKRSGAGAFLAAPHFEPEWTTSPSTALTATRGHFQWGFYDNQWPRQEIPFETLDELRELVRRVYVAGGGGGQGPDGAVPPEPMRPSGDDGAGPLPDPKGTLGEIRTGRALDKLFKLAHPHERRELVSDEMLHYMRDTKNNQLIRFVADTLSFAARHPQCETRDFDTFREWGLAVVAWAMLLSIIAQQAVDGSKIIKEARNKSRRSSFYDRMVDSILDLLSGQNGAKSSSLHRFLYLNAVRRAPLVTLPRFLPLPKKEREMLPSWANSVADAICILGSSHRRAVGLARNYNIALIAGSGAAMVLSSLSTITDTPTFTHDEGDNAPYADQLLGKIADWIGENIAGPDLERNIAATEAFEEYLEKKVGIYHSTP